MLLHILTNIFLDRGAMSPSDSMIVQDVQQAASGQQDESLTIGNFSFTNITYLRDMNQSLLPKERP